MTWQRVLGMPCNPQREIANVVASTVPSPPLPMRIFWETNKEGYYRTSTVSLDPCLSLATMAITQAEPSWTKNEETGNSFIPPTTNLLLSLHSSPNHFVGVWGGGWTSKHKGKGPNHHQKTTGTSPGFHVIPSHFNLRCGTSLYWGVLQVSQAGETGIMMVKGIYRSCNMKMDWKNWLENCSTGSKMMVS